jgi:uncharacterized membrane protein
MTNEKGGVILAPMSKPIVYAGDTTLTQAASYLAGIMQHYGLEFDYLASDQSFDLSLLGSGCRVLILSDYPARNFGAGHVEEIERRVSGGMGLLMIGGWESFTGEGGDYGRTPIGALMPVAMQEKDDRINCSQPCVVELKQSHPAVKDLPFESVTPTIGGYNRVTTKPAGKEILSARRFKTQRKGQDFRFIPIADPDPLLVTGSHGKGRVTAYASDAAPHWVGGLVDWGDSRITACAAGAHPVEVGNWYARFFNQMIRWTMGE